MFNSTQRIPSAAVAAVLIASVVCVVLLPCFTQTALADGTCVISPSTLPDGTAGTAYSVTLEASGGTEPYTWTVIGGALPDGLTLSSSTGAISGTPTTPQTYSFIVRADDSAQHYCTMSVSITVNSSASTSDVKTISTLMISKTGSFILVDNVLSTARELASPDGRVKLNMAANTTINMQGVTQLGAATESKPPAANDNSTLIRAYSFMPTGATFSPAATMTLKYEKASLPSGALESDLYIAYWNGASWVKLSSTIDTGAKEVSARVAHFTVFAIRYLPPATTTATTTTSTATATTTATTTTTTASSTTISASLLGTASSFTTSGGKTSSSVRLGSADDNITIILAENTTVLLPAGIQKISVTRPAEAPNPPADSKVIEAFSFEPANTTLSPAASVTVKYDPAVLPDDVREADLYLALLKNSKWTNLSSKVNTTTHKVTAKVSGFYTYALLGKVTATPAATPAPTAPETPAASPSANVTASSGDKTPAGMAVPVLVIIIAGGLLVIGLGIAFVFKRKT